MADNSQGRPRTLQVRTIPKAETDILKGSVIVEGSSPGLGAMASADDAYPILGVAQIDVVAGDPIPVVVYGEVSALAAAAITEGSGLSAGGTGGTGDGFIPLATNKIGYAHSAAANPGDYFRAHIDLCAK